MDSFTEMDSFTKNLIERTKDREQFLKSAGQKILPSVASFDTNNQSRDKTVSEIEKVLSTPLKTAQVGEDKREGEKIMEENKENNLNNIKFIDEEEGDDLPPPIPSSIRGLAALRRKKTPSESSTTSTSIPSSDDAINFSAKPQVCDTILKNDSCSSQSFNCDDPKRRINSRLAQLAQNFNEWEDDSLHSYHTPQKSYVKSPKKVTFDNSPRITQYSPSPKLSPIKQSPSFISLTNQCQSSLINKPQEKKVLDSNVITSLEAYGFQKTSPSKITFDFAKDKQSALTTKSIEQMTSKREPCNVSISPLKVNPEPAPRNSLNRSNAKVDRDDPSTLPIAARRALFEQKMRGETVAAQQANYVIKTKAVKKNPVSPSSSEPEAKKYKFEDEKYGASKNTLEKEVKNSCEVKALVTPTDEPKAEEMSVCSPPVDMSTTQENNLAQHNSVKDFEVAEALAAFKDIDAYSVTSGETTRNLESLSTDKATALNHADSSSSLSDISSLIEHVPDCESPMGSSTKLYPDLPPLEEGIHAFPPITGKSCSIDKLSNLSPIEKVHDDLVPRARDLLTMPTGNGSDKLAASSNPSTPVRTLSMYRREQKMRAFQREKETETDDFGQTFRIEAQKSELVARYREFRTRKIQELREEATKYNNVIFQSLRALELCVQTHNLSERVEAEKILLINTKKKEVCVEEIYRLQSDDTSLRNIDLVEIMDGSIGRIKFSNLILLVKGDFFVLQASGSDLYEYHFICLFISGDKVIATDALSSTHAVQEAALAFHNRIQFDELPRNFSIRLEIYALSLPKIKIGSDKKIGTINLRLTPKSKAKSKYTHSPALSASQKDSVSSSFKLLGHVTLTRDNCTKTRFDLANFMYSSPLEGEILLNSTISANYHSVYRSYLNFYEQSGDYPTWNRRWCVLDGYLVHFWRYSEDEGNKPPMGVINLKECVNPVITKASTDICMRAHSFAFLTIEIKASKVVTTRHLMAADIKKERDEWLEKLNTALKTARFWEPDALHPYDDATLERLMK